MRPFPLRGLCAALAIGAFGLAAVPATAAESASRMIVKFKPGALAKVKAEIAAQRGRVVLDVSELNALAVKLTPKAVAALRKSRHVEFIERDLPQYAFRGATRPGAFSMTAAAEVVPYGIPLVQADQVSDAAAGNRTLCIIDSGIDGTHPDLQGLSMSGENLTTSGAWNTDESAHGTHVAGTIAAVGGNGVGVVGVLPNRNLNLYIAKVFDASGSTSSSTVAKAMWGCYRRGGADVISMSLGGSGASRLQATVARLLDARGVLMFAAAGNGGSSAISYPAGFPEVISVAGVDALKQKYVASQFNPDVEIAAPGVGVLSTVPVGTGSELQATVGGTVYSVTAMAGTPGTPSMIATGALYNFGLGTAVDAGAAGKVCLIQRGGISFADKVLNCQASGGVGAIIYNNAPGPLNGTLGMTVTTIPSVGATDTDGAAMLAQVGQSATVDTVNVTATDYAYFDGTSMATPHASGVAALVWSRHTGCTAAQIRASLNNSAEDLGATGRDDEFGHGLVQAAAADRRIASLGCGN
jgi:subtilisin family serine protease